MAIARRIRDAGVILRALSTEVRFPRAIVRYRLPMSVVFSRLRLAVSSGGLVHYFLFIARLIARSASLSFILRLSLFLSHLESGQVQIVCIVRILPIILAIILNSSRNPRVER